MDEYRIYPPKEMPKVSVGACVNSHTCKAYATDLADGWCINCWDKGNLSKERILDGIKERAKVKINKQRIKDIFKAKRLTKLKRNNESKAHRKNCACEYHKSKGFV